MRAAAVAVPFRVRRALAAVAAWLSFVAAWWYVASRPGAALLSWQLLVLPASLAAVAVLNAVWVGHNRRIYARKGPRRGLPALDELPTQDRLGRPLRLDVPAVRAAREVVVDVGASGKTFTVAS